MCPQLELQPSVISDHINGFSGIEATCTDQIFFNQLIFVPNLLKVSAESKSQYKVDFGGFQRIFGCLGYEMARNFAL